MRRRNYHTKYRVRADYDHFLGCYFQEKIRPVSMQIIVASYEGGGYSETKENERRSAKEHEEIVKKYMSRGQIRKFKLLLALSLAPLRTKIAESKKLSGMYQKIKAVIYRRKG